MKKLIILILLAGVSCRSLVDDNFPAMEQLPVVNGFILADSAIKIHLSYSANINALSMENVEDAEIEITNTHGLKYPLVYQGEGIYRIDSVAKQTNIYQCKVSIPGYDTLECIDTVPESVMVSDINHIEVAGIDKEGQSYAALEFTFENDPQKRSYYEVGIKVLKEDFVDRAELIEISDSILLNEGIFTGVFSNALIKSNKYRMKLNYTTNMHSYNMMVLYPIVLEFKSISYSYYQYKHQLYLYEKGRYPDNLLSTNTIFPLYSNIRNGLGIFASYTICSQDTIYPNSQ